MNKITIIIGAAAAVIAASAVGYTYYMTHPSVECTTDSFSFKIPRGFKVNDNEYIQDTYGPMYKYGFGGDIIITEMDSNQTPRAFSETLGEDDAERKKIDGTPLECYNIENNTKHEKDNVYLTGTDNHFLIMETDSSFINGFLGDMAMKNIVKTVKYTSDYRLADLPDEYDNEYFHISTGGKYSFSDLRGFWRVRPFGTENPMKRTKAFILFSLSACLILLMPKKTLKTMTRDMSPK